MFLMLLRDFIQRLGRGGGELVLPDQKGVAKVVPRRTFQSLINVSFPKIVGEPGAGEKTFSDMPFFHTNLPKFVQFFSNNFVSFSNFFSELHIFCPTSVSLKLLKLPDKISKYITTLGGRTPPPHPQELRS